MAERTLHEQLSATAHRFIHALSPRTRGSNDVDDDAILANLSPDSVFDFGHAFFVSSAPRLQGAKSSASFVSRMRSMAPSLKTWEIDVREACIDSISRTAVLRADFQMVPNSGDAVLNEILFWLGMDGSGEKVIRCTEFIDPVAAAELRRRMAPTTEEQKN